MKEQRDAHKENHDRGYGEAKKVSDKLHEIVRRNQELERALEDVTNKNFGMKREVKSANEKVTDL
jgi:hypothetical protein